MDWLTAAPFFVILGALGVRVAGRDDAYAVTAVSGGRLDESGEQAILEFEGEGGRLRLAIPMAEVAAVLSVCIGLAGQRLPQGGEAAHATIPVADWRVGVSDLGALVLGLAPAAGGALAFHLTAAQAGDMAEALERGLDLAMRGKASPGRRR